MAIFPPRYNVIGPTTVRQMFRKGESRTLRPPLPSTQEEPGPAPPIGPQEKCNQGRQLYQNKHIKYIVLNKIHKVFIVIIISDTVAQGIY